MSNQDISRKINQLKDTARFGRHQFMNLGKNAIIKIFGKGRNAVSFIAVRGVKEFDEITEYLYNSEQTIVDDYSLITFQEELCRLLKRLNQENRKAILADWKGFIKELKDRPDISVKSLASIYGVTMNERTVTLGDFTIYKPSEINQLITNEYPRISKSKKSQLNFGGSYVIGITVKAKDFQKCYELADKAFSSFENVANFITAGFHKTNRIGIFNYSFSKKVVSISLTQDKVSKSTKTLEQFGIIPIDNPLYQDVENGNKEMWQWITIRRNDLQQKILDSIEWAGKALVESDDSKALLQYIISIEALLQYDEGKFIVPSIVSQLSDMVAFLLGESHKQRVSYSNYIKDLYKIRSSITHSGKSNINDISLHTAHVLTHKIIRKIITHPPYKTFVTKKSLCKYLIELKFGIPENDSL